MKDGGRVYCFGKFAHPGEFSTSLKGGGIICRFDMHGYFCNEGFISTPFENYSTELTGNLSN
jgi:hypothetical protein